MAKSRAWLVALTREVSTRGDPPPGDPFRDVEAYEGWVVRALHDRGFDLGMPLDVLRGLQMGDVAAYDEYALLNATAHQLVCALALLRWQAVTADSVGASLVLLAITAHAVERADLAERVYALIETPPDDERDLVRAVNDAAVALGSALEDRSIGPNHPLLGHPFHQILRYQEALRFLRVAWLVIAAFDHPGGRPAKRELARVHGETEHALYQAIHATVALAAADGTVDDHERRLIDALVSAARCGEHEANAIRAEFDSPPTVEAIAADITDPLQRGFVLRLLLTTAHVNGRYEPSEADFLEQLANLFEISPDELGRYEAEALQGYEQNADLVQALSLSGVVRRMRKHLARRIERVVRKNARRLADEVRETSELFELLAKAGVAELSDDEKQAVRSQLTDICKTIPALAIFAIPGGSVLLPIAIKHLPFDVLPSNFIDREEL